MEKDALGNGLKYTYQLCVSLSSIPVRMWVNKFRCEWRRVLGKKKRKIAICNNEIKVFLSKNDNIQDYIDILKNTVCSLSEIMDLKNINMFEKSGRKRIENRSMPYIAESKISL